MAALPVKAGYYIDQRYSTRSTPGWGRNGGMAEWRNGDSRLVRRMARCVALFCFAYSHGAETHIGEWIHGHAVLSATFA